MTTLSSPRAEFLHLFSVCVVAGLFGGACRTTAPSAEDCERAGYQRDLGITSLREGDYRRALDDLLKGEKTCGNDADLQYALGLTYFTGFGRLNESEMHLKKAISLRENFSDAYNALGNVYLARNDCPKAIPLFQKAMDNLVWPTPYLAEQNLGWCLHRTGQTEKGLSHLKNAVNTHQDLCGGYDYLARIYVETGKEADSVVWLDRYIKYCDTDRLRKFLPPGQLASVFYRVGMARVRADDKAKAREAFATCLERFPDDAVAPECRRNLSLLD